MSILVLRQSFVSFLLCAKAACALHLCRVRLARFRGFKKRTGSNVFRDILFSLEYKEGFSGISNLHGEWYGLAIDKDIDLEHT